MKRLSVRVIGIRIVSATLLLSLAACTTVPITGRSSFQMIPAGQLTTMSLGQYKQVLEESELSQDPAQIAQVRRVGQRLAQATETFLQSKGYGPSGFEWEFNVIKNDEMVNAWAMPGGKIAVYTGLLPIAQNDEGLATVMGHEIAHVVAGHGNERMSQGLMTQLGGAALSVAVSEQPALTQQLFMGAFGAGAQLGILLPYSRLHESEADRIGLTLMALGGFDPRAAIPFWERMGAQSKSRPPQLLSSHPMPETRVRDIQKYLPEALALYRP